MALSIKDWSTDPNTNGSVDGVAIAEGVTPFANMNNAVRAVMAATRLEVASFGTVISAASTPDIGIDGGAHTINGTTTIVGFATAPSGLVRTLHFETTTPIVPGANLALPGGLTSATMVKGGVLQTRSLGGGSWKVEFLDRGDGKPVVSGTVGKHKIWIPVTAMAQSASSPPAAVTATFGGANNIQFEALDFDASAIEIAYFNFAMPSSWNEGTVTFVPVWTAPSGSGDVVWRLNGAAVSNDDAFPTSYTNGVNSTDTLIATNDLHRGPESSALTLDGSPAANDLVLFRIIRFATDGGDTFNADARLLGIELYITTDAAVDVA